MREDTMSEREASSRGHLSSETLLQAVYGIAETEAEAHLSSCADCAGRMHEWRAKRAEASAGPAFSNEFLAAQRRAIYARVEAGPQARRMRLWWAPALAAAGALAVGVLV